MSMIRNQIEDLKHLVSKENKTSRGFYIFVLTVMLLLVIGATAAFIAACMGLLTGSLRITSFAALPVVIAVIAVIVKVLSKR